VAEKRGYWLFKSEPDVHSWDMQCALPRGIGPWDGVRNYQARNWLRDECRVGDRVLFYHSNCAPPHIAGICEVVESGRPDPTQFDPASAYYDARSDPMRPRWYLVEVQALAALGRIVSLDELRAEPALASMRLVQRGNRLSVMPVTEAEYAAILALSGTEDPPSR
jgi:predicted RNA-binding protein with PUA-like domain